jgi:hypothetical protein
VQFISVPFEHRVRRNHDLDEEIPHRAAVGADLAFPLQLDPGAGVHTWRHLDGQSAAAADAPFTRALRARVRDGGAEALALRARTRGHDLTEEGPLHRLDLAHALAHDAGLGLAALGHSRTGAGGADGGGVHGDVAFTTENGRCEIDLDPDQGVLPAAGTRARTALPTLAAATEERVHNVAEIESGGSESTESTGLTERIAAHVVHLALVRVGEDFIGRRHLLEALLVLGVRVHIRVQFARQPAIGLLDLLG